MEANPTDKPVVYIFHGNDEFEIAKAVEKLYARMGDPGMADLNTTRLDGRASSEEELRTASNAIPFLAERRLVILAHAMVKLNGAGAQARYEKFFDGLPETTALVLVIEDSIERGKWQSLRDTHWLRRWAQKAGPRVHLQTFPLPSLNEMPVWIMNHARELGGQFHPTAAQALASHTGSDTRLAGQEIEKLLTYVDFTRRIEADDVEALVATGGQSSVFEMVDALAVRNKTTALKQLHALLEEQEAISLFGMVIRQFRLLIQAREILDERGTAASIQQALGVARFIADKLYLQAQRFTMEELEGIYHRLLDIDEAAKTSQMPGDLALDLLIAEM